jgi:hypothetical protein
MLVLLGGGLGFGIRSGGFEDERFSPSRWKGADFAVGAGAWWFGLGVLVVVGRAVDVEEYKAGKDRKRKPREMGERGRRETEGQPLPM